MDELLMQAMRNGWRIGPGTVVERQSLPYRPRPVARLRDMLGWLKRR